MATDSYIDSILKWRKNFEANLRGENNWMALAGLFWLHEGTNTIGSDPESDIVLPERVPRALGALDVDGTHFSLQVGSSYRVKVNGATRRTARLRSDQAKVPSYIELDGLRLVVIERPSGTALRMWDNKLPARHTYPPLRWYPVAKKYYLAASYTRFPAPRVFQIPDIFGSTLDEKMDGELEFQLAGGVHRLLASEQSDGRLFIQFSDLTNGKTTYPSGRYHYTAPARDGRVFLDFNKAYSPPCVFTPFATCTFAPQDNHLKLSIRAGQTYLAHP